LTSEPPYSQSPLEGLKSRLPEIPLIARVILLVSLTTTLLAAILVSYRDESLSPRIIVAGMVAGVALAAIATVRSRS
jgi:hypothetical protein